MLLMESAIIEDVLNLRFFKNLALRIPAGILLFWLCTQSIFPAQSGEFYQLPNQVIDGRLRQYTQANPAREAALKKLFSDAGCTDLQEKAVPRSSSPNVACTLRGTGEEIIVVGAHFDHVHKGDGVVDNWSGASLLPSLYQSLRSKPRRHTFVFIGFTDEEKGMIGSLAYVHGLSDAEIAHMRAMIDIDTLGLGPTEVWVHNSDPRLVRELFSTAEALNLPAREMNVDGVGDSDGHSFKERGIPIITLHSVTSETLHLLHTNQDNISAILSSDYYGSYQLIAAFLAGLDSMSFRK